METTRSKRWRRFDHPGTPWDTSACSMLKHTVRMGRVVVGTLFVVVGIVLALPLVPGPGLLLVFVGLTVLSEEFEWARQLRDWVRGRIGRLRRRDNA